MPMAYASRPSGVLARDILLSAPAITAILAGLFAPLALMFVLSFLDNAGRLSVENYQLLIEPFYLTGLMTTFKVAFAVAFIVRCSPIR